MKYISLISLILIFNACSSKQKSYLNTILEDKKGYKHIYILSSSNCKSCMIYMESYFLSNSIPNNMLLLVPNNDYYDDLLSNFKDSNKIVRFSPNKLFSEDASLKKGGLILNYNENSNFISITPQNKDSIILLLNTLNN